MKHTRVKKIKNLLPTLSLSGSLILGGVLCLSPAHQPTARQSPHKVQR